MAELGMSPAEFAARLRVSVRTVDRWLLPDASPDAVVLLDAGRSYINEVLVLHRRTSAMQGLVEAG
jgi:hypothetical protein